MTIQEAIKSGRRRKLPEAKHWQDPNLIYTYNNADLLRDDWEIEREPREIWVLEIAGRLSQFTEKPPYELSAWGADKAVKFREVIE